MACDTLAELLEAVVEDSAGGPLDTSQLMSNEQACLLA